MSAAIFFGVLFVGIVVGFTVGYIFGRDDCDSGRNGGNNGN